MSAPTDLAAALQPRYADVSGKAGLYESLYLTAHHLSTRQALWIRHTVLKPPGEPARASLWCSWFDEGGVRAGKVSTTTPSSTSERPLVVGDHGWMGVDRAEGSIDLPSLSARWDLRFREPEPPMRHLPQAWMYSASLPRTKSMSAAPQLTLGGSLEVDGSPVDIDGWPCSIGHNWGAEHAERWIWLHADAVADVGPVWLDVVLGRIRIGPVVTPWIGNGVVSLAGDRRRLGGLRIGAGTRVVEQELGATVTLRGKGIAVEARSEIDLPRSVGWTYADPAGATREVVNSSVARTTLTIGRDGRPPLDVEAPVSAFELGGRRRAFDVPLQPFPD